MIRDRNDVRQYDDLVDQWWAPHGSFAMLHWIASARASLIPPASHDAALLVDIGAGAGLLAPHAQAKGYRHVGVDITSSALVIARAHGMTAVRGDVRAVPLRDGCADVVVAGEILEHVTPMHLVVCEACRVLRGGGLFVLDTIAATPLARLLAVRIAEHVPGGAPKGIHDPALFVSRKELLAACEESGVAMKVDRIAPGDSFLDWVSRAPTGQRAHGEDAVDGGAPSRRGTQEPMSPLSSPGDIASELVAPLVPAMAARADKTDLAGDFPTEDFAALREAGLLGLMVPRRLGGLGCTFSQYASVAFTLAQGNGATALVFNMHASVTGALALTPDALARAIGADDTWFAARDRLLSDAAKGVQYAVAMSERKAGSRLSALEATYEKVTGGYHLNAEKSFVSGAGHVGQYLVAAHDVANPEHVSYLIVSVGEGVEVRPNWDALGMRATASHDVVFDCFVGEEGLVGGVPGLVQLIAATMPQWLVASYAAVYAGVARASIDACVTEMRARHLAHLPAVRARIGRADAQARATELIVADAARLVDEASGDKATNRAVYRAKLMAGDTAVRVASSMLEAAGASATRRGNPLERLYRDARCGALQPATSDVCADWLGVDALGGDPDHVEVPRW